MKITEALSRFREEFADVKSLADVPRLSPERLKRFKQQLDEVDPPAPSGAFLLETDIGTSHPAAKTS
jgi:hypothetical protein